MSDPPVAGRGGGIDAVLHLLACPACSGALVREDRTLRCPRAHAYDIARHGYVSLLAAGARTGTADTAEMVAARAAFLGAGHYAALTAALAREVAGVPVPGAVLDVGAGTGHHLAGVLDAAPGRVGLALDVSRYAARHAARAHPRAGSVVADAWTRLPVGDAVAAAVLDVFAPRNGGEAARVLVPGGALLVVTPAPGHLHELAVPMGMLAVGEDKPQRLAAALGPHLDHEVTRRVEASLWLTPADAARAVGMGPSSWHVDPDALRDRAGTLPDPVGVTLAVEVSTWRRARFSQAG